MYSKNKHTFII